MRIETTGISLSFKLRLSLLFRGIKTIFIMNTLLCLLALGAFFYQTEKTAARVYADAVNSANIADRANAADETSVATASDGTEVVLYTNVPQSSNPMFNSKQTLMLPSFLYNHFSSLNQPGMRYITWSRNQIDYSEEVFSAYAVPIEYRAFFAYQDENLMPVLFGGEDFLLVIILCLLLLASEFLMLFWGFFSDARLVKKTLRPIEELARQTQYLEAFAPEQLEALAGELDEINAARLDTRIPLNSTRQELQTLASAINGMLERINTAYRSQARFVSDASHELRTPISVIQGYVNLLDRWGKNDPQTLQESINAIKDETANMRDLVEQLLFLARGDSNTLVINREEFNLSLLAEEVLKETQMIDKDHTYRLTAMPKMVTADKSLIKQAMRILIDNAIKYTPTQGLITLSVVEKDDVYICFTVQDEGIGIAPQVAPQIFDRFFRADESRTRATGGAGLGLSIAKWITHRHGGYMEVLSRQEIGTRVTLVLPNTDNTDSQVKQP